MGSKRELQLVLTGVVLLITYVIALEEAKSNGRDSVPWDELIIVFVFMGFFCWAVLW